MGAPKIEKYPIQILSLTQIRVDHSIQSRVETSMEYQREFSEAMLRGDTFPPTTVFFDGKVYWLADGFHRYGATKQAFRVDPKLNCIRAEVRNGTRRDAVVYSAGANQKFSIPRTKEDVRKAFWMLMDDPEWFAKPLVAVSRHIGMPHSTALKYRVEFATERGLEIPLESVGIDGRRCSRKRPVVERKLYQRRDNGLFYVKIAGKHVTLGSDRDEAIRRRDLILDSKAKEQIKCTAVTLRPFFLRRDLNFDAFNFTSSEYAGLSGCHGHGVVWVPVEFDRKPGGNPSSLVPQIVGQVLLAAKHMGTPCRSVVVCYLDNAPPKVVELARQLGVEFLTPDELVASLKGDQAPPGNN